MLELQQQLKQATIDLNESTHLLEEQKKLLQSKFVNLKILNKPFGTHKINFLFNSEG